METPAGSWLASLLSRLYNFLIGLRMFATLFEPFVWPSQTEDGEEPPQGKDAATDDRNMLSNVGKKPDWN